jgi:hypothetical protein
MTKSVRFLLAGTCVLTTVGVARAQLFDHLHCLKIKDSAPRASYTITTDGDDIAFTTCTVKLPAKLACFQAHKITVSPTPPGGGPANPPTVARTYFCYKTKCSNSNRLIQDLRTDQFGPHTFVTVGNSLYCAPASPSGAFLDDPS